MPDWHLAGPHVLIAAVSVLWFGKWLNDRLHWLKAFNIPIAVSGGLVCSALLLGVSAAGGPTVAFDMALRDILMLGFFATIGVSARVSQLFRAGSGLLILVACTVVFLFLQNATGVGLALWLGEHPGLGLFAGSISLAGGHGTAIAWGEEAAAAGIEGAQEVGILFATLGLVMGGLVGGPFAEVLIRARNLAPSPAEPGPAEPLPSSQAVDSAPFLERALDILFILALCIVVGDIVNRYLFEHNFRVPGFLTAMFMGIFFANIADVVEQPLRRGDFELVGGTCLQLFLAMSLMTLDLSVVAAETASVLLVLFVQTLLITLFAEYVLFRMMGGDYDAAVIAGGFCGLGMGATPVALANVQSITSKHGASPRAFLLIPLVGAFFLDVANALIVKNFLGLEFMGG